jgi:6-phosphogluconate dehydrogenase
MSDATYEFGIVGLGRMGGGLAHQALEKGMRVYGFVRKNAPEELFKAGLVELRDVADFRKTLRPPRFIFLYITAGPEVDQLLDNLSDIWSRGIVIDGGNSYWGDSIRRQRRLKKRGLHFIDLGTSGGVEGARHGASLMAGRNGMRWRGSNRFSLSWLRLKGMSMLGLPAPGGAGLFLTTAKDLL